MQVFWLFVVCGALCLLEGALFFRVGLRFLSYRRGFSRKGGFVGERVELTEVLENRSPLPVPWLRAESRISRHLRFGAAEAPDEHDVSADMYHRSLFFLSGFSRITRRHPVALLHRGYFSAGSVALSSGDLFGLRVASRQLDTGAQIAVYPRLLDAQEIPPMCRRFLGELLVKRFIQPDPFMANGIRPYQPGDAPRDVNWRASARMDELCVNTFDFTADPSLLVVLNVQLAEHQWGELSEIQLEGVEWSVSLAQALCLQALEGGAKAGFAANTDTKQDEGACVFCAPQRSHEQADALLLLFARLTLRRVLNFYTFLERLDPPADADVLILSPYTSEHIESAMDALRARGHSIALQLLTGGAADDTIPA